MFPNVTECIPAFPALREKIIKFHSHISIAINNKSNLYVLIKTLFLQIFILSESMQIETPDKVGRMKQS